MFAEERTGEEATDEALAETRVAESTPDIPAGEPEAEPEVTDASIEADAVAPEEQGPGDSEGESPAAPDEAEQPES